MATEVSAVCKGMAQRELRYTAGDPPAQQTLLLYDVSFQLAGMPPELGTAPSFTLTLTDGQTLQIGVTYTINITGPV